eukprot:356188-Chlamydomonas_euryale.AAC.4
MRARRAGRPVACARASQVCLGCSEEPRRTPVAPSQHDKAMRKCGVERPFWRGTPSMLVRSLRAVCA